MSRPDDTNRERVAFDDDCVLPVAVQNWNIACFAAFWSLFYLAAPVSYIGLTHANLLEDLGNSDTVNNLPLAVYMWMTVVPVFVTWAFPQPRFSKRLGLIALGSMAVISAAVAAALWRSESKSLSSAMVIAHGAVFGAVNGISLSTLWDLMRRGVSTSRRGKALGFAFGVGPIFACIGALLQDACFSGQLLGGSTFGLSFPQNYVALFAGAVPLLVLAGLVMSRFVVDESSATKVSEETAVDSIRQFVRNRNVLFVVLIYILVYSGGNAIMSNISLEAKVILGDETDTVGLQNFLRFGCKAVAGALLGVLLAKVNPRATLVATTLILVFGVAWAIATSGGWERITSGWWYMATFGILGAGELFGAHFPNYLTTASSKRFVRINMAYLSVLSTIIGFSSVAFGLISDHVSRVASFYTAVGMLVLSLFLIYLLLPANPTMNHPTDPSR
jgi:hypothetical protein